MSSLPIPNNVKKYLGFGTKFIPKLPSDPKLINDSIKDFTRRVRIKELFKDKSNNNDFNPVFHIKSNWDPGISSNSNIEIGLRHLRANVGPLNYSNNTSHYNSKLNNIVPKPFHDFIHHPDIIIKPSDKNLGLTVLDKSWYMNEGLRQLEDTKYYSSIPYDTIVPHMDKFIHQISKEATSLLSFICSVNSSIIDSKQVKYLNYCIINNKSIPTFHLLPKIHKTPVLGRPIVPSHSWLTTGFSVWIDSILQKVLPKLDFIIKDTKSLVNTLEKLSIPSAGELWLVTGDVSSMYTNIPTNEKTYKIISYIVDEYLDLLPQDSLILERTLAFIMNNNYFKFNDKYYRQVNGIAMGTACAPTFANIFMYYIESSYFENVYSSGLYNTPLYYGRYIDDIFFIFNGSKTELDLFLQDFDNFREYNNQLKISWTSSNTSIDFLDLVISVNSKQRLELSTHQKTLNKYLYVPFSSYHPKDNKTGFIKAELIRYVRNSSTYFNFAVAAKKFFTRLRARGYPPRYLIWVFSQVHYSKRSTYLLDVPKKYDASLVPFITTYNPIWELPNLKNGLRKFSSFNPTFRPVIAFKRNKNINDLINKANVRKLNGKKIHSLISENLCWSRDKKPRPNSQPPTLT